MGSCPTGNTSTACEGRTTFQPHSPAVATIHLRRWYRRLAGLGQQFSSAGSVLLRPGTLPAPVLQGQTAHLTVGLWQGKKYPLCVGAAGLPPWPARASMTLRDAGEFTVRWTDPAKGPCKKEVKLPSPMPAGGMEVMIEP